MLNPKWIIGKRVAQVSTGTHYVEEYPGRKRAMHQPVIYFDDGSAITFVTEESPDGSEYGIDIIYCKPPRKRKR